jgi:hypothetical protein
MLDIWNYTFTNNITIKNDYKMTMYNIAHFKILSQIAKHSHLLTVTRDVSILNTIHMNHDIYVFRKFMYILNYLLYLLVYDIYDKQDDDLYFSMISKAMLGKIDILIKRDDYILYQCLSEKDICNFQDVRYLLTGETLCIYKECHRHNDKQKLSNCSIHTRHMLVKSHQIEDITNITLDVSKIIVGYSN